MRISIYIDGANFYHGVRSVNEKYTDTKFDFEKFIFRKIILKTNKFFYNSNKNE